MNIKSLLIGSAATMVAVSGAQAADAVVVEPEPVEYVRVCDAYGTGFFFIPGTETCIAFNGFIRSVYSKQYEDHSTTTYTANNAGLVATANVLSTSEAAFWGQRARFNMDTRNETEWGQLRGLFRLEADGNQMGGGTRMDVALISLGGLRAGYAGANYWSTNHGFGGVNIEAAQFGFDGPYGFGDSTLLDYTFAADGFSVTIGVEDRNGFGGNDFNGTSTAAATGAPSYANFYAGFNYSGDWGGVAFTAVHDSSSQDVITNVGLANDRGNWAWKGSVNLDLSSAVPGGALWGWYMDDGDAVTGYVNSGTNADSIWGVAFEADITDEVAFWANYWNVSGGTAVLGVTGAATNTIQTGDSNQWGVGLNWYPSAAPGFHIKAAYMQGEADRQVTTVGTAAVAAVVDSIEYDAFEIVLRRDF